MSKAKAIPSSQISLLSKVPKCRWMWFYAPGWNIPPISNLYPVDDQSKSIPLTSVMLNGTISNSSASISFAQTFKNDSESPIECIYKFPSDYSFAVVGLTVKVGDKTIEAEVMEKKQAEEKYDDAVAAGHTAVKLNYDEKLPDIIELNIGQLQPGDTAEIWVKMVWELEVIKHGFFSLIFPLDFFPRYGAEEGLKGERGSYLPAEFGAEFNIKSSSVITNLDVSHEGMRFEQSEDGREVRVTMDASKDIVAKDIVISYSTEQIREPQLVLTKWNKYPNKVAAHISFIPRSSEEHEINEGKILFDYWIIAFISNNNLIDEEAKTETPTELDDHDDPEVANGEFIFILDRSGSMGGGRIRAALAALELFIRSIPPNSKFNVISFGSTYQLLYEKSVEYNNANMENAIKEIKTFSSDLGGTELYSPINYALSLESDHQWPRNVFVLTDGDISDTQSVLNKIREFNHHTRVHSFGIGSGASIFLVKEIAKEGKGSSTLVADNDPLLNAKVIKALKKASKPAFTNISVDWMENKHNVRLSYPKPPNVPYIYEEEPFHFYAILSENDLQESNFTLTFYDTLKGTEETLLLKIDPSQIIESNEGQDFQMTAKHYLEDLSRSKEKIDDSEIVSISVEYSVLNSKTAFFGKIKNSIKSTEEMKTIEIPVKKLQKESLIMEEKFRCLSSNVHLQRSEQPLLFFTLYSFKYILFFYLWIDF